MRRLLLQLWAAFRKCLFVCFFHLILTVIFVLKTLLNRKNMLVCCVLDSIREFRRAGVGHVCCSMRLWRKQLCCTRPSLFLLRSSFTSLTFYFICSRSLFFMIVLLSRSSFFGLLCRVYSCCLGWKSNFSSWVVRHCIGLSPAEGTWTHICLCRAANKNTLSLKWPVTGWKEPVMVFTL